MLYALRMRRISVVNNTGKRPPPPNETASTLSEACCQCARRSFHVLTESWINGSFPTYDFTYTQYLFSASLILAISSLSKTSGSLTDGDDFEIAMQILSQLDKNGNFAAKEFYRHIDSIKTIFDRITLEECQAGHPHWSRENASAGDVISYAVQEADSPADTSTNAPRLNFTEPLLDGLLSQPNLDLGILDPSIINDGFQAFMWPEEADYSSLAAD